MYITRKTVSIKLVRFKDAFAQYDINILQIVDGIENVKTSCFRKTEKRNEKLAILRKRLNEVAIFL